MQSVKILVSSMSNWLCRFLLVLLGEYLVHALDPNDFLKSTIAKHNYPVELHPVSSDGYHLTMARVPKPGKPILFLMHSFLSSSTDFTVLGPKNSLAFEAFDSGFDVWLANGRGNTFSRSHRSLHPSEMEFWDFSFHEVATQDIPTMIDYVLNVTGRSKVHYVGHSQGGTNFLVMASMRPEYNRKIGSAHLSSPVAFWSRNTTPLSYFYDEVLMLTQFMKQIRMYEIGSRTNRNLMEYVQMAIDGGCITHDMLMLAMGLLVGDHRETFNGTSLEAVLTVFPAGGSLRQGLHFLQTMKSERFCQYDYGEQENLKRYGEVGPPDYALEKITAPVALYYGMNDPFLAISDLDLLAGKLPNLVLKHRLADLKWNHIDFIFGSHGSEAHQVVLKLATEYE
ncbi:lipase 3-like [Ochlerotatus camptorhynchus]|uniref:lipase 3-like n=1 Tax=Ochlerotatus camptorhynchus TaxID=644619 RepID=UPI0031D59772